MSERIKATATRNLRGISAGQEVLVDPGDEYTRRALTHGRLLSDEWSEGEEVAEVSAGDEIVAGQTAPETTLPPRRAEESAGDGSEAADAVSPPTGA